MYPNKYFDVLDFRVQQAKAVQFKKSNLKMLN